MESMRICGETPKYQKGGGGLNKDCVSQDKYCNMNSV